MSCDCRKGATCADHLAEADLTLAAAASSTAGWVVYPYDTDATLHPRNADSDEEALTGARDFMAKGALRIEIQRCAP